MPADPSTDRSRRIALIGGLVALVGGLVAVTVALDTAPWITGAIAGSAVLLLIGIGVVIGLGHARRSRS